MSEYIIGLTGGIGSGKSTVAALFKEYGIELIDADLIAREAVSPQSPALKKIAKRFGERLIDADGSLNRRALREIIFQDQPSRIWLEALLHPLIRDEIIKRSKAAKSPYCITVIPLLKLREDYPILNRILVVDAPESLQISRIQKRDQVEEAQAKAIVDSQI